MKILKGKTNIDFVGLFRFFALTSGILLTIAILAIGFRGLNFGIDFAGGYEIHIGFSKPVGESEIRAVLKPAGLSDIRVQRFGAEEENEYLILVREQGTVTEAEKKFLKTEFEMLAGGAGKLRNWSIAESGERLTVGFAQPISNEQVEAVLGKASLDVKAIRKGEREDQPDFVVELVSLADKVEVALREGFQLDAAEKIVKRVEFVGPQVGKELQNQGLMAIIYALGFILFYIAVRFDFAFAPGAVLALVHDVLITVGVFALFQLEFNLPIVAAILALVGYSLNDTIVVYDRIRENAVRLRGRVLGDLVNTSINQTMSRTLLTSFTTLTVVLALLVFGGGIIRDFSIALCVGVLVGTYSSVAVASPSYIYFRERTGRKKGTSEKPSAVAAA